MDKERTMRPRMEHNHLRERRRRDRREHAPACTIGQAPLLVLYKAEKPSVCPSAVF